mmetsp:Transcript_40894/g.39469  ORF Transcript_40894/g.39469 Transcript_40894/m.39469 type:complete len:97 (+) Transcript_40894:572-862(+)
MIQGKPSYDQVSDIEVKIMEKINQLFQALMSKFAEKSEMRKQVKAIEVQLKNLYELLMSLKQGGGSDNEEDAMIAKKPLGGWSCISCEKNIVNLHG